MADDLLPDPLPEDPLRLFNAWFEHATAKRAQPNPDSMVLASVGENGAPSARVVLCKRIDAEAGYVVFFTNYESRKGRELTAHPRAAAVFHWDHSQRQVRIEGPVVRSPETESDRYFASRALSSRIGAWASHQSAPLENRSELIRRAASTALRYGLAFGATEGAVPRPPHWGGFRLWIDTIELWSEGAFRIHDRALWRRDLARDAQTGYAAGPWSATRLNP
jgi:pyridoxamine 5'-phosphate oxidase